MKNASQSGVGSLNAPRMRGLWASPERLRFLAAVAAEVAVQQIHHRPEVATFLDIDLEQVAQIVERRAGETQMTLLFDRRRFGVALSDDEPPQVGAIFARHFLPCRLALVCAEVHLALGFC